MSIRKEEFINGEIYHITVRGVEGRQVFVDDEDRWRGIFSLYEFNTTKPVIIRNQREKRQTLKNKLKKRKGLAFVGSTAVATMEAEDDNRDKLVEIFAFVFMPNHLHLLLRQKELNGVSAFMQKFGSGYSMYFNKRYQRKGHLFQGKFSSAHILNDNYLKTAFVYVHTNPIALIQPGWKKELIEHPVDAKRFIEEYRWSSYLDYIGKKNFPSVTERDFITDIFSSSAVAKQFIDGWIDNRSRMLAAPSR
jgi:putative transposase